MQAIVSLGRFNVMSEHVQDEFEPERADEQGNETRSVDPGMGNAEDMPVVATPTSDTPQGEDTLPPEARGETNGGPLGCCLGVMVGLLLSLSLAVLSRLYADPLGPLFQGNYSVLGLLVRILMLILAVGLAIVLGRAGWRLGKRFYREYDPPSVRTRNNRARAKELR